jgi:hypothetical protein
MIIANIKYWKSSDLSTFDAEFIRKVYVAKCWIYVWMKKTAFFFVLFT